MKFFVSFSFRLLYNETIMTMNIAIVEDNPEDRKMLVSFLKKYEEETKQSFSIFEYDNGEKLLCDISKDYDFVFMDIMLPIENGLDISREMRKQNFSGEIVFVTNMCQYAIMGYEVDALAFLVKPISYFQFENIMNKAVKKILIQRSDDYIVLNLGGGYMLSVFSSKTSFMSK